VATEIKSSGVAIVLSFFWTGLGQLYAGKVGRGLLLMALTPVVWAISFFGGFMGAVGSLSALVSTDKNPAPAQSAGIGVVGIVLMMSALVWWLWGIIDAKKLCEAHNRSA